jgi:Xaa-Pro aminopeptidase
MRKQDVRTEHGDLFRDDGLSRQRTELGITLSPAALHDLVAGVAAAPEGSDPDGWLTLLPPACDGTPLEPEQIAELHRLRRACLPARPDAPADRGKRLAALRTELAARGLDGFIVPRADQHQGEYVPARAERLAWLTGFTGSAGLAVVLARRAALFVDGRYTLQVCDEVAADAYEFRHLMDDSLSDWLIGALPTGGRVGYDSWLHTQDWADKIRPALTRAGIVLVPEADNPVDRVWPDQPRPPLAPVVPHQRCHTGRESADKRATLAGGLRRAGIGAAVLTLPDSIAWLLNIRGGDVPRVPVPLCFALLFDDGRVDLFIDTRKLVPALDRHWGAGVTIRPPDALPAALDRLGRERRRVQVDPATAAVWLFDRLAAAGAGIEPASDPCALPKACKTPAELDGARAAHRRDGVALCRFLHWLETMAPGGTVTELGAAQRLDDFRRQGVLFRDLSFDTISAAGAHGAVVHYRVTAASDSRLDSGTLYLVDSGGQYLDGTTDVTRTVAIGTPSAEMRTRFTRVLRGHIALATVRFPVGTTGSQLDVLARRPLWEIGLDYDHGTGHGVGSYLGVHEGPQRISKLPNRVALQPGMILSNEPGCYVPGRYGIRIENLQAVQVASEPAGDERAMLTFETLTLAPIDRNLIDLALLLPSDVDWLDRYHQRVWNALGPLLDSEPAAWLKAATRPLGA